MDSCHFATRNKGADSEVSSPIQPEFGLWTLFRQLQRHQFPLGVDDYLALRTALRAGFGWSSRAELCTLCCSLWAKSLAEQAVVRALFDTLQLEDWALITQQSTPVHDESLGSAAEMATDGESADITDGVVNENTIVASATELEGHDDVSSVESGVGQIGELMVAPLNRVLPPLTWRSDQALPSVHVFLSQFPTNYRIVSQTWRRLWWPVREGPKTELDIQGTIESRIRTGVATPPVLRSSRRNRARLLLLVDRQGSMAPFHAFVAEVRDTISKTSRLGNVAVAYFHDVPLDGADSSVLQDLTDHAATGLDPVLSQVSPLSDGVLFADPELLSPLTAIDVLEGHGIDAGIVVISDAGAARRHRDLLRLLDTVAFLMTLKSYSNRVVWLNPMPIKYWLKTTAAQIGRHVPMFPMDADGMHYAVNVLRGQPFIVERPI